MGFLLIPTPPPKIKLGHHAVTTQPCKNSLGSVWKGHLCPIGARTVPGIMAFEKSYINNGITMEYSLNINGILANPRIKNGNCKHTPFFHGVYRWENHQTW